MSWLWYDPDSGSCWWFGWLGGSGSHWKWSNSRLITWGIPGVGICTVGVSGKVEVEFTLVWWEKDGFSLPGLEIELTLVER